MAPSCLKEQSWEGTLQQWGGNIEHQYANGVSSTVVFGLPTATKINSLTANDEGALTARAALDHLGMFVTDTWAVGRFTVIGGLRLDRYRGWLPEQHQLAASVGPVSVAAKTFPEKEFYTWNQVAPRFGVVYDLSGDGKMVVKANYGFYWHSPGIGVSNDGNPNTALKSATYTWSDRNGDRRWQPGEESAAPTSASLEGTVGVDANIKAPYTHDAGVFFERQLGETLGLRTGFVYKTEDNLIANYQPGRSVLNGAFSVPFPFVDVGRRRRTRNERRPQPDAVRHADGTGGQFPGRSGRDECPAVRTIQDGRALGLLSGTATSCRFRSAAATFGRRTFRRASRSTRTRLASTIAPAGASRPRGLYDAPYGIRISPVFRHQSGVNFARQISVPGPRRMLSGLTLPASIVYADSANANREENVWLLDIRAEKAVNFTERMRAHLFLDLFNITNSHKSELLTRTTGANYLRPGNIMAPFTARIGVRLEF